MKKKNNYKPGIWVMLLLLIASALATMGMYPVFARNAEAYQEEQQQSMFEWNMYSQMYESAYVLYYQAMEAKQENQMLPYEVFLTEKEKFLDQELYISLAPRTNEVIYRWMGNLEEFRQGLDYVVVNKKDEVLLSYAQSEELENIAGYRLDFSTETSSYLALIELTFDNAGRASIQQYGSEIDEDLHTDVERFIRYNRLAEQVSDGEDAFYFSQPKDISIFYGITENSPFFDNGPGYWETYISYHNAGIQYWFLGVLFILMVAAFLILKVKRFRLHDSIIVRLPFEIAVICLVISLTLWQPMIELIIDTNTGQILTNIQKEPLIGRAAVQMVTGINVLCWMFIYGIWFSSVASLGELFFMGGRKYFAERSICIRVFQGLKQKCFLIIEGLKNEEIHKTNFKIIRRLIFLQFIVITIMCMCWFIGIPFAFIYSCVLCILSKKYLKKIYGNYQLLLEAAKRIAEGDLEFEITEDIGIFHAYKVALEDVQNGFQKAVAQKVASQNMKTELITNVSHDLKTPLTAIITYINLLQDENITPEERQQYIETIDQKAGRLKVLIEDLFEISKAESKNISLNIAEVDLENLLKQVKLELEDKITEAGLIFRMSFPAEKVLLPLDSQKTYRIFENLYVNCIKYALRGSRVYVELMNENGEVCIWVKNTSAEEIGISETNLSERFVRGDLARNTEGSGLGLAIARSFAEVQGGYLTIQVDGDFFKVGVHFPQRK